MFVKLTLIRLLLFIVILIVTFIHTHIKVRKISTSSSKLIAYITTPFLSITIASALGLFINASHYIIYGIQYPEETSTSLNDFIFYGFAGFIVAMIIGIVAWLEALKRLFSEPT